MTDLTFRHGENFRALLISLKDTTCGHCTTLGVLICAMYKDVLFICTLFNNAFSVNQAILRRYKDVQS